MRHSLRDARVLGEGLVVIVLVWLALGHTFGEAIEQSDGSVFVVPYTQSALAGGFDWTHNLYRFGVLGGSSMHDFAGTLPIVQLCALFGLGATTTVNLITVFVQLCFGFFGVTAIDALIALWGGADRRLSAVQRVIAWCVCAFAPLLGSRLAVGHDNLLFGLLPYVAALSGWCAARAKRVSATTIVMIALAVWHGVATLGAQSVVNSVVFGVPLAIAIAWAPRGERWSRDHAFVVAALVAGVLVALPRLAGMIAYATGDDTARTLGAHVTYSFSGPAGWRDWIGSIPWTARPSADWFAGQPVHEHNFPLGPLVVLLAAAWPRTAPKRILVGLGVGAALVIGFAGDVTPISDALLAVVRPLQAFRAPTRAMMPIVVVVPWFALAAVWARNAGAEPPFAPRVRWLAIAVGLAVIAFVGSGAPIACEIAAWLACVAVVLIVRRWPRVMYARDPLLAIVAALGVCAFTERFPPRSAPNDPIEHGPTRLRAAILAKAPELAMPLARVEIVEAPLPYIMSTAWAAGLGSLDGDYNPLRRYLMLIAAASDHDVPPDTVAFQLARDPSFTLLQQLYNVHYAISVRRDVVETLPATPGAAWFPDRIDTAADAAAIVRALRSGPDLHANVAHTAWLLAGDAVPAGLPTACSGASVGDIATDAVGQSATLAVRVPATDCTLVVSTNYVSTLRAHGDSGDLQVVPIDVALTGIVVPRGTTTIVLAPIARIPVWTRIASLLGALLIAGAIVLCVRRQF